MVQIPHWEHDWLHMVYGPKLLVCLALKVVHVAPPSCSRTLSASCHGTQTVPSTEHDGRKNLWGLLETARRHKPRAATKKLKVLARERRLQSKLALILYGKGSKYPNRTSLPSPGYDSSFYKRIEAPQAPDSGSPRVSCHAMSCAINSTEKPCRTAKAHRQADPKLLGVAPCSWDQEALILMRMGGT